MANNRMTLVNTATGQRVLLATHLATEWRALAGIEEKLDQVFTAEFHDFPTAWGSTAWRVEYEEEEPELDEELRRDVADRKDGMDPRGPSLADKPAFTLFYEGPLSQWHPAPFTLEGHAFTTAEHYMMWSKARLFDEAACEEIRTAAHPGDAKRLGRQVRNFDERVWSAVARQVVFVGSVAKFSQNPDLRGVLLRTEGLLVEASPTDLVWGIGLAIDDPRAADPARWLGSNWLGTVLTEVREALRRVLDHPPSAVHP